MPQIFTPEKKAEIKAQLLKEVREMMLERGITGMDIEELAASAGIAKGMFYIVIGIVGLAIPAAMIGGITVLMGKIF